MVMPYDANADATDDALLRLYALGDGQAARELTARLAPRLVSFARRMLGDVAEAEDVVQETMLRLWKIAPQWQPGSARVSTWAFRVASNLCTDRLRRRRGQPLDAVPEPADDRPDADQGLIEADRLAALDAALARLPQRQRQAVVLRHIEGLSNPEIAETMGIGVEAVESLTARAKRALAAMLAGRKEELGYDEG
ncbi:MAG: RNA polymerase sigma factor [Paracoccaceae bacterium]